MTRYSAIALVFLSIGTAAAADKTFDRTFAVSPGGTLTVDADSASVRVSGGDTNKVAVHMVAHGTDEELASMKLDAVQNDGGVTVTMRRAKKGGWFNWGSWHSEEKIEITVPRQYGVNVQTGGGSVELADTNGTAVLKTSGGDIDARNLNGNVEARTSGGGIRADRIRGDVDASTSGGDVRLLNVDGKIRGNTSGEATYPGAGGAGVSLYRARGSDWAGHLLSSRALSVLGARGHRCGGAGHAGRHHPAL